MNLKKLHERFKDDHSPSVEGQIRWLQKQGFAQHQIQQAMVAVYSEIERGEIPQVWSQRIEEDTGKITVNKLYFPHEHKGVRDDKNPWTNRDITTGHELDKYLLSVAKELRTKDLTVMVHQMEEYEQGLKKKWEKEREESAKGKKHKKRKKKWFRN